MVRNGLWIKWVCIVGQSALIHFIWIYTWKLFNILNKELHFNHTNHRFYQSLKTLVKQTHHNNNLQATESGSTV